MKLLYCLLVTLSVFSAIAAEPAWWTQQKINCGLPPSLDYETWRAQGMPCPRGGGGYSGPSPQEIERQRRQNEANELWKKGDEAWKQRNWEEAIYYNQLAAEKYPEFPGYLENVTKARDNQRRDAIEIPRDHAWNAASAPFDKKDYREALRLYLQAQALRNEPALERNIRNALVSIPRQAASAAFDKKDYPEAFRLRLQALALENSPDHNVEYSIQNLQVEIGRQFPNGVPPRHAGLTDRALPPVGPSAKADALFKLRVEKAFSDQSVSGLQSLKEKSGFVFDEGRVMNPAALPDVNAPPGQLLEEATALAKAALVLPRAASERADAPPAVTQNAKLKSLAARQAKAATAVEVALGVRNELFQQGTKAKPEAWEANNRALSKATYDAAITVPLEKAAGGSEDMDLDTHLTNRLKISKQTNP